MRPSTAHALSCNIGSLSATCMFHHKRFAVTTSDNRHRITLVSTSNDEGIKVLSFELAPVARPNRVIDNKYRKRDCLSKRYRHYALV
jgi:hypothetical protein